jgi:8-oxo-dGTP pyrophosphatase MutT (NUDIX family)
MPRATRRHPQTRQGLRRQAAALACRVRRRRLEVLLVTSSDGTHWVVPKGNIEPGEPPWASAQREALEEAGLVGRAEPSPLGRYRYTKRGLGREVEVFLLEVTEVLDRWLERRRRRRKWVELEAAVERVREPGLKALLTRVGGEVRRGARPRSA